MEQMNLIYLQILEKQKLLVPKSALLTNFILT